MTPSSLLTTIEGEEDMHSPPFPSEACSRSYAESLDSQDRLRHLRSEFIFPSKADLKRRTLAKATPTSSSNNTSERTRTATAEDDDESSSIYLCGNSLGLQPKRTSTLITEYLTSWATKGVTGHFTSHEDSSLPPYLHVDDYAAELMAPVVGAKTHEVVTMGSLTANLHLMMCSFYRPDPSPTQLTGEAGAVGGERNVDVEGRHKIILEGKAFPSDHFAVESQITHHGHDPLTSMITLSPSNPTVSPTLTTSEILATIDAHASTTALILLPGIQFYTGQLFDIPTITAYAHAKGIPSVGWDLAHAVGNVELALHDWDVDFAVWCNYKYVNAGPGCIAGAFVHEKHGQVDEGGGYRHRLAGWWGADKVRRFQMDNKFIPRPGAPGYQLSNPSALDLTALIASLQIFSSTSMSALRQKSLKLTGYLEHLLDTIGSLPSDRMPEQTRDQPPQIQGKLFEIITPRGPRQRGAQLSVKLVDERLLPLDKVLHRLERAGVVVDERKPDVIRVAPAPLYNSFEDVWNFSEVFRGVLEEVLEGEIKQQDDLGGGDLLTRTGEGLGMQQGA